MDDHEDDDDEEGDMNRTSEAGGKKSTRHMGLAIWNMARGKKGSCVRQREIRSETEAR